MEDPLEQTTSRSRINLDEVLLLAALDAARDGLVVIDATGACRVATATAQDLLGEQLDGIVRGVATGALEPASAEALMEVAAVVLGDAGSTHTVRLERRAELGGARLVEVVVTHRVGATPDLPMLVLQVRDLSYGAMVTTTARIEQRDLLSRALNSELARFRDDPKLPLALLTIEVSNHSLAQDSLGPSAAEAFIFRLGKRLADSLRPGDLWARLEGPVFAVLLRELAHTSAADDEATRLTAELGLPIPVGDKTLQPQLRMGFTIARHRYASGDEMLRDAQNARRRAPNRGQGMRLAFESNMYLDARLRFDMEASLPGAAERGEMELHYQPLVRMDTGRVGGFEALLRWRRADAGLVLPDLFIQLAEEIGAIHELGYWVLDTAVAQAAIWVRDRPPGRDMKIAVNVSPRQLSDPELPDKIAAVLEKHSLHPARLELELTEGRLIEAPDHAEACLHQIKQLGVSLSLDDFGTGYSSLSHLHRYPFDVVKIDRFFVTRLGTDDRDLGVIRTIHTLARHLGLRMVAEGVETPLQRELLRDLRCDYAQGWLFGRALTAQAATRLLEEDPRF